MKMLNISECLLLFRQRGVLKTQKNIQQAEQEIHDMSLEEWKTFRKWCKDHGMNDPIYKESENE